MKRGSIKYFVASKFCITGILLLLLPFASTFAQHSYWLFLKDKPSEGFDPAAYFDRTVLERKMAAYLPLFDSTDLPVNESYISVIKQNSNVICFESRWLNAVKILSLIHI